MTVTSRGRGTKILSFIIGFHLVLSFGFTTLCHHEKIFKNLARQNRSYRQQEQPDATRHGNRHLTTKLFETNQQPPDSGDRNNKNGENDEDTIIDDFLDKQFFNPDDYDEEDTSMLGRFANLVKSDYALAETVYVGIIFVVMVIVSQELLRMQLYGDNYVPFTRGVTPGKLF